MYYSFLFFLLASFSFAEPAPTPSSKEGSARTPIAAVTKFEKKKSDEIDLPAPVGEEMKGITIPQYDVDGKLKMKLSCEAAHKTDEHNVAIHGLKVEFFEKDGQDVTVTVPDANFNLATTLLTTEVTTTIKREDFNMVGDRATFDTTKRFGTMKGHVHTEIRNGVPKQD